MNSFTDAYDEKIRPLMDKIDQVRSLLSSNEDGITFPNVVVVGDQSSGKSTLLEALSLVELPKGSGIVTRCPLVLRLRRAMTRTVYRLHGKDKTLLDESTIDILKYIEEETQKLAGTNKNVVHELIELQVEDPKVRDLTVVDLPGIARISIADQPKDIYKQTTDLIRKFIRQEGSVILCVFPANVDAVTVESFNIAREFDPESVRTIGVITKSDLAPKEDALIQQLLMDKSDVLQLKLGFIAVRNRSADEKISLEEARQREKEFFQQSSIAGSTGWDCLGIDALINRLADLYADRVRETFPKMRAGVQVRLKDIRDELSRFPPNLETPAERLAKYYELADFYVENIVKVRFNNSNDGKHISIINALHGRFTQYQNIIRRQSKEFSTSVYRKKVETAMAACYGEQLPNFLPHPILKRLIAEKLNELWTATEILINESLALARNLLVNNDTDACQGDLLLLKMLPVFRNVGLLFLQDKRITIHQQLQDMIRIEKEEPYTLNSEYMEIIGKFKHYKEEQKTANASKPPSSSIELSATEEYAQVMFRSILGDTEPVQDMLISIYAYWQILTKRFTDYVSLSLRSACVFDVCSGIRQRLREIPAKQVDFVETYLAEDALIRARRKQLKQTKDRLDKVETILGDGFRMADGEMLVDGGSTTTTLDQLATNF